MEIHEILDSSGIKKPCKTGIAQGIVQAFHGKASPLKRKKKEEFVIYYSGKQTMVKPDKCQEFIALGKVIDDISVSNFGGFLPFKTQN